MAPPITFHCPLPPADLLFESMSVEAGLGRIGEMRLHLLSLKPDLAPDDLLGQPVRVELVLRDGSLRHWSGHCIRFGLGKPSGRHYGYDMTVRPWPWFLTRTSDCRIFQDLSVPDIVRQVLADHAVAKTDFRLFRSYAPRGYCVQYRESDFDFIARLLEQEGISWFFQHDAGGATLVLVDAAGAHDPAPGAERIAYYDVPGQAPPDVDCLWDWSFSHGVRTGRIALTDYDFERPSASLRVSRERGRSHEQADLERFDYPGLYRVTGDGEQYADNRLDEQQARHAGARGTTSAQSLAEGCRFTLERHPRDDQNTDYLVTAIRTRLHLDAYESGSTGGTELSSQIEVIPHAQQFRPPRLTPKPFVQGPQTAVVVGPAGEEIHTDKYGRVKVQFHWDRYGRKNEKSSCWIRVSHPWAGKNFGAIHIPRIGQEVVVSFLEGDPDQPLITGRVYNAEQMPPWDLPANMTQSGILTRSSKGGGYANANAIRFEDKKGAEQLWIHAEKNQDIEVENDETHWVGHDRSKTVDHDETVLVKNDRTETVGRHETIAIGVNRSISVGGNETATVAIQRTHVVGANETIAIGAAQEIAIGAYQTLNVGARQDVSIGENQSSTIGQHQTLQVGGNLDATIGKSQKHVVAEARTTSVGKDDKTQVGKKFYLEAGEEIVLKTGEASLVLKKDGTIQIKGKDITVFGSGKIGVKASGDLVLKGAKIAGN